MEPLCRTLGRLQSADHTQLQVRCFSFIKDKDNRLILQAHAPLRHMIMIMIDFRMCTQGKPIITILCNYEMSHWHRAAPPSSISPDAGLVCNLDAIKNFLVAHLTRSHQIRIRILKSWLCSGQTPSSLPRAGISSTQNRFLFWNLICRNTDRRASFIQLQHTGSHFFTFTCRVRSAMMGTISSLMLPVSRSLAQLCMWLSSITTAPMGRATALCTSTLTSM